MSWEPVRYIYPQVMLEGQEHLYHFYGNTTDLYTKGMERTLVLLW